MDFFPSPEAGNRVSAFSLRLRQRGWAGSPLLSLLRKQDAHVFPSTADTALLQPRGPLTYRPLPWAGPSHIPGHSPSAHRLLCTWEEEPTEFDSCVFAQKPIRLTDQRR